MSKSKVTILLMFALLLCSMLSCTARPEPRLPNDAPLKTQHGGVEAEVVVDESCEGVGDDECLMRRTLAAHVDYIYTQKQKH